MWAGRRASAPSRTRHTERHKGRRMRRAGVGSDATEAADVWAAAGMAHARAAALHQCATIDACRHSWAARGDAADEMKKAAVANGRAVGGGGRGGGRISRDAIAESGAALHRAVDALDRAAVEFGLAAKLSKESADGWARAEAALARAGHRLARVARTRSDEAREMAHMLGTWAKGSRDSAGTLGRSAGEWVADTADWKDGEEAEVDMDAWMERQGGMVGVADTARSMAEDMARTADEAARVAAGDVERVAAEAEPLLAAAARAGDGGNGCSTASSTRELRDAEAALRAGMEAAERASGGGGGRGRQAGNGA